MTAARILLVDDDRVTLDALSTLLNQHGYITVTCQEGAQALEMICQGGWDLVILDIGLPSPDPQRVASFDGIKVLQWLARLHRRLPVLVFTSIQDPGVAKEAMAAGALGVIRKGDPIEEFLRAIRMALAPQATPEPKPPVADSTPVVWSDNVDRLVG